MCEGKVNVVWDEPGKIRSSEKELLRQKGKKAKN